MRRNITLQAIFKKTMYKYVNRIFTVYQELKSAQVTNVSKSTWNCFKWGLSGLVCSTKRLIVMGFRGLFFLLWPSSSINHCLKIFWSNWIVWVKTKKMLPSVKQRIWEFLSITKNKESYKLDIRFGSRRAQLSTKWRQLLWSVIYPLSSTNLFRLWNHIR